MGELADYFIEKMIENNINMRPVRIMRTWNDYWTTIDGKEIPYEELTEKHARAIFNMLEREGSEMNPKLLKRLAEFDDVEDSLVIAFGGK